MSGYDRESSIEVTKDEVTNAYLQYLIAQHQSYFDTAPSAKRGEAAHSIVEINSRFEAEHVNGILRYMVGARPQLSNSVGIFPVFNQDAFNLVAHHLAVNKILANPDFQYLVKDTAPLIELSDCQFFPELLKERNAEEKRRNEQDKEADDIAQTTLATNGINSDMMLVWYLQAIASNSHSFLGNLANPTLTIENCSQLIIPFRKNENHYTVAVVNFISEDNNQIAKIQYYDSLGEDLDTSYKNQLAMFLMEIGFQRIDYKCVSKPEQNDKCNCAIFASFKAIDLSNENIGNTEQLLQGLDLDYSALFNYFRNRVTEMLRESGCNISLSPEMIAQIKLEQAERDKPKQPGIVSWLTGTLYNAAAALIKSPMKRLAEDSESENLTFDPFVMDDVVNNVFHRRTVIAKRIYPVPSAALMDDNTEEEATLESDDDSQKHTPKKARYSI